MIWKEKTYESRGYDLQQSDTYIGATCHSDKNDMR